MKRLLLLIAVLGGCAAPPEAGPPPTTEPAPPPPPIAAPPRSETVAVASLMENARADASAGRLANAAASLERALRIEPRNPRLWHELARVRLRQGLYAQAESMAARSNAWAGDDQALRDENARIIAEAREKKSAR